MTAHTNSVLAFALLAAIFVSLGGIFIAMDRQMGITGLFGTNATGNATIVIGSVTSVTLTDSVTDFGSRTLNQNQGLINTESAVENMSGSASTDSMTLENDGNVDANVTINATANMSLGTGGDQFYRGANNEASSCQGTLQSTYTRLQVSPVNATNLCLNLSFVNSRDTILIHYRLLIVSDATAGQKQTNVTIYAVAT